MRKDADLLLRHGTLVTMDAERRTIADGAVAIRSGRIIAVGATDDPELGILEPGEVIECKGKIILPGFIDAHGHGGHSLIKTLGSDAPSLWMRIVTPSYFHYTTPSYWYADGLVSALERLRAGVTCGVSVMGSRPRSDDPRFGIEHARAYHEVGIREVVAVGPSGLPWPHPVSRWDSGARVRRDVSLEEMLEGAEAVIETCNGSYDDQIRVYLTPFTIVPSINPSAPTPPDQSTVPTDDDRLLARRVRELAAKKQVRIHSDAFGGMVRMAAQDRESALLGPDVHLQHCIGLSLEEVGILAETGTAVGHAPGGRAPVAAMMNAGIPIAITTDGHATQPYDLLQTARQAQFAQRLLADDFCLLPPGRLLEMITIEAAKVIGWDDDLGSIECGKRADLIVLNGRQPHLVPYMMPAHQLISAAVGHDVETVVVNGRVVMRDHDVLSIDMEAAMTLGEAESALLVERAGLESHLTAPGWRQARTTFTQPLHLPDGS